MSARLRFRDVFKIITPWWLSDRRASGKTVGYRILWCLIAPLDVLLEGLFQGMNACFPGLGTPTALPLIGRGRGILRGQLETNDHYGMRLRAWLTTWERAGTAQAVAEQIHEYLGNRPMVRVINRSGDWVTVAADGTVTRTRATWNWDGVSHPERAGFWSELFIVIYPTQWAVAGTWGDGRAWGARDSGLGHRATHAEVDAVKGLLATWKSAHSMVRAVIWTSDATLFDPAVPLSCPDGTWGAWGTRGSGARVASGRNTTTCRYWEPG